MRASRKTAQGLSGAHAYSRLPFVSPVRGHVGIPKQCRQWDKKHLFFSVICTLRRSAHQANPGWWCFSLSTAGTRGSRRRCHGGPSHRIRGPNSVTRCVSSWVFLARCIMSVQSRHWLEYDPVALVVLLVGMSAVAFLVLSI